MDPRETEKALQESERRLAEAQRLAHIGSYEWDILSDKVTWSDELYRIYGLEKTSFAATAQDFLAHMHRDDRALALQVSAEAKKTFQPFSYYYRIIRPDGVERIIHGRGQVVPDGDGLPLRMYGTAQDVTDRVLMEREAEKAHRLESVGLLAAGIAHDFNNILMGLVGNISLARATLKPGEKAREMLAVAEAAALRAGALTKQLLTFSKGGAPVKKPLAVRFLLGETATFALRGSNVKSVVELPEDLWPVNADEGQIAQVVHNLAINAVQAMPAGGEIVLRAENVNVPEGFPSLKAGKYVRVTVRDTGPGIPPGDLLKIFEPYFTTKRKGSGLGLTVCRSIVEKHGGSIAVESTPGAGTAFHIHLPATDAAPPPPAKMRAPRRGEGRILLMDDDATVRDTARRMLEHLGYGVECAAEGGEALEAFETARKAGKPFGAVIMDLTVVGGLGGLETAARLLRMDPAARIIASSGYSDDPVMARHREAGFRAVLHKPYEIVELSEVVAGALAGS
jgi:PAS domain S-box-containing protein